MRCGLTKLVESLVSSRAKKHGHKTSNNVNQKKATLLYITKYEKAPYLYNVRVSECSLYTRAWHHAVTTYDKSEKIQYSHPFIVSSGIANFRFVTSIIEEHMANITGKILTNRPVLAVRTPFRLHPHYAIYLQINQRCKYTQDIRRENTVRLRRRIKQIYGENTGSRID
jgi:hypothetical protein